MTPSQRKSRHSNQPLVFSGSRSIRFCLMLLATLRLFESSLPSANAQSDQAGSISVETKSISASTAIEFPRLEDSKSPTATDLDENFIFFPPGSAMVDDIGKEKLRQHAEYLKQNPKKFATLVGATDGQGSRSYNLAIGEERLMAVNSLLRTYGVPPRQIRRNRAASVKNPIRCTSVLCRQQTHTVELVYSP